MAAELIETCIDDVLRTPAAAAESAAEEASTSSSYPAPREDPLSLSAARLKQLELESSPRPAKNVNVNMAMNNQEDIVKIADKCVLSSAGSSPEFPVLRTPDNMKSNILKAQVEAAALKGCVEEPAMTADKNCNIAETSVSGRPEGPDMTRDIINPLPSSAIASHSAERLSEDSNPILLKNPSEPAMESLAVKVKAEEVDVPSMAAPLTDNLIDFTDPVPVVPAVQPPKPLITPRWIIPTTAPPCAFTNGLLDVDPPAKAPPADRGAAIPPVLPAHACSIIAASCLDQQPASEDGTKPRGLLTTEL